MQSFFLRIAKITPKNLKFIYYLFIFLKILLLRTGRHLLEATYVRRISVEKSAASSFPGFQAKGSFTTPSGPGVNN